jgi:uncharacterized protein (TIGR00369 family)
MDFLVRIPFVELLGMKLERFGGGEAEITLPLRDELTNSWSVVHGGVTMTLLDVAMAHAARSPDPATGEVPPGVVTVEMKTSFLRPGLGVLTAYGRLLHKTASMAFCEGSIRDGEGALVAHATGTFKYMRRLPAGGRKIQRLNASD